MLNIKIIFILSLCALSISAQDYKTLRVKEEFDYYSKIIVDNYSPYTRYYMWGSVLTDDQISHNKNIAALFGDGMARILEGYITMYQITGDKAYLYKFVLQSLCIIEERPDYSIDNTKQPRWAYDPFMYLDGQIIAALSKFAYFVKFEEPFLIEEPIYQFDELNPLKYERNTCFCNRFDINFIKFGQYADWLINRVCETLDWYLSNGYWDNNLGFKEKPDDIAAAQINMQIGFSRALLFVGLYNENIYYLDKAKIISSLFKSNIKFFDFCRLKSYKAPVFIQTSDNSYWWYHNGWRIPYHKCIIRSKSYSGYTEYIEDISHGINVTWLFLDFFKYQPNTIFTIDDMIRLRNMFSKHIYNGNNGFYNSVLGTDGPVYPTYNLYYSVLNFMPFSKYDGADATAIPPNVYDIIMEYYYMYIANHNILPDLQYYNGGFSVKGQAEIVQSQWEHECTNLTLYNRKIIYNQDFYAKSTLTISPQQYDYLHQTNNESFAEPLITQNIFTVDSGTIVNMIAGEKIILKHGTHIKAGSRFRAYIDPLLCMNYESRSITSENNHNMNDIDNKSIFLNDSSLIFTDKIESYNIDISPNPFTDYIDIYLILNESCNISLKIINIYGNVIYFKDNVYLEKNNYNINIPCYGFSPGLYNLIILINNEITKTKIIIKN